MAPVHENSSSTLVTALVSLSVGGVIGDFVDDFADIVLPVATAFAIGTAGYAGLSHGDVTRAGAIGGGLGLLLGTCVAILDRIIES